MEYTLQESIMVNSRLLSRGSDFLNRSLAEHLRESINLEKKIADDYWFTSPEKTNEFRKHLAHASKCVKGECIEGAGRCSAIAHDYMEQQQYELAFRGFCEAATVYAAFGLHRRYGEAVSNAALARFHGLDDKESAVKMLATIDTLINHYLAARHVRKGPGKNPEAVKELRERRAIVHKKKAEGNFNPKERWPRTKWRNYHAEHQGIRTAVNLIYIKAAAFCEMDAKEEFDAEYSRALSILDARGSQNQEYQQSIRSKFEALRESFE